MAVPMTEAGLNAAIDRLCAGDADLAGACALAGRPVLRRREPGFATLLYLIVEQQLSLTAAAAIWRRLAALGPLTAGRFTGLDEAALRAAGLSRPKIRHARALAAAVTDGGLDLAALERLDDADAAAHLTAVKGIGRWTAEIYLMSCLGRPDVWPAGDVALQRAVQMLKSLPGKPAPWEMDRIAEHWRPWRSAAAHLLWNYYRFRRGIPPVAAQPVPAAPGHGFR